MLNFKSAFHSPLSLSSRGFLVSLHFLPLEWCVWYVWKLLSHARLFVTLWTIQWNSPGQNTRVGSCSLLQGIFPTQGLSPGLWYFRWILYQRSHQGNPRILEWIAYPFSRGSSQPRNQTGVSCIAGRFFISWATRKALILINFKVLINIPKVSEST